VPRLPWAALVLPLAACAHDARPASDPVDALMQRVMAEGHIPGAAVAVVRDGKVVRLQGYGVASSELAVPVTADTRFQIASATKMYTAVLLMRLVEQGKLGLDDPVTKFIPNAPAAWGGITIRHLATHTSGIGQPDIGPGVVQTADAMALVLKTPLTSKPGVAARYGSMDFTVLQSILERASGKPFATLLHDALLVPVGLPCISFDNAVEAGPQRMADDVPNRAEYYRWVGQANQRRWFLYTQYAYAAGGAYACIRDMAHFVAAMDSGTLLRPASRDAIWTVPTLADGTTGTFGIGWVVKRYRGHRWVGHSGGPALSDVMYFPDDHLGIIVLTNQQRLYPQLASLIADLYIPPPPAFDSAGLADDQPALAARARAFLTGTAAGTIDTALVAASPNRDAMIDDWDSVGPGWLALLGPLTRLTLVSADAGGRRTYRALYGHHGQSFAFVFDAGGRITDVDPVD
jgi:CubicO group peptidase (beta-lactamase class C family)